MKKVLLMVLCLYVFLCNAASAEETDPNTILLKVTNLSDLEISYMRFDLYRGDEYIGLVASCPNEGEDFYRCPIELEAPEEAADLQIRYSYGISELPPEEAALQVMMNNPAEEHPLPSPELTLACGGIYSILLVQDLDSYELIPYKNDWNDWSVAVPQSDLEDPVSILMAQMVEFFNKWSIEDYDAMVSLCTADWKAETKDPSEEIKNILDNRKPATIEPWDISGTDKDQSRIVTARVSISRDGGLAEYYMFQIVMRKEKDGIWRVDPRSLQDCEPVLEEK